MPDGRPPLALIAGPTASGKSDLAVRLSLELQAAGRRAVIVNADSAQVYADLCVLSARPAEEDMQGIEHRLFGAWDGAVACSAADWARAARREIEEVHSLDAVPILVGGTGLYVRTLLEGIAPIPGIEPAVRDAVRRLPVVDAYAALLQEDPDRAAQLAPADTSRIARALEVVRSTGRTLAQWHEEKAGGIADSVHVAPLILLPDREALYRRCDARFEAMLENGAIAEVEALLDRNLDPALPVMHAIGVPEIAGYLRGEWTLGEACERGARATRNYAKRQYTWLRHQPPAHWQRAKPENFESDCLIDIMFRN
ncbi:tRNA dimethylallyltransferase [Novosphingobium marinum]|uniref:tRNA dimethylallyltransferase n=1 Tax=Novosphingobium marinum TaxID=1514948 RepID=A0A7Y9XTE1_9SPHN|nr:tRNA (adenosine(37)-N6)-dimethylallyltransferase MiaA [Novosphingobium marinum]NYH94127.1 tRNA dimethylallyltransferase [Novosphingobium marinum]GGC19787.1 tRNA dimethylallyltransferase [Novosphingobium marinum]